MALTTQQQIHELLRKSNSILVVIGKNIEGDTVGSALAINLILEKMGKTCDIVSNENPNAKFSFLPNIEKINPGINIIRDFIISVNIKEHPIKEIHYEAAGDKLNIYLSGQTTRMSKEKIEAKLANPNYDLLIVLNSPDLSSLGEFYEKNTDFFFNIPIINIDHSPSNENFGKINMVDILSSSTAEVLTKLFYILDKKIFDEKISTCLLTGIISETNCFQAPNTAPSTLICSANLIMQGADQSQIVTHLYKTKPISILKLLGRIMAGIKIDSETKTGWTFVDRKDFWKTKTESEDLNYVLEELVKNSRDLAIIFLLWQKEDGIKGKIYISKNYANLPQLTASLSQDFKISVNAADKNIYDFSWNKENIFKTKKIILNKIKNFVRT